MSLLQLFMVIFSPSKLISFTKLRFRRSFGGAQYVKILIGSKAMTKNTKGFIAVFYHFEKQKAENLCLINGHFRTIFWSFFGQLHSCLSKNRVSDGHFEVLDMSKSKLVQIFLFMPANA